MLERQHVQRNANRAKRRAAAAASEGTCTACALRPRETGKKWCTACLDRQRNTPGGRVITLSPPKPKPERIAMPMFIEATDDDIADLERIFA